MRGLSLAAAVLAAVALGLVARVADGQAGRDVSSVFFVAKSENRNQVHYGVHLDGSCAPEGAAPAFAYWRMLEKGPTATEGLLDREIGAYGFVDQRVVERGADGGRVIVHLHALPSRPISIQTTSRGGSCDATATMTIASVPATLSRVFVQLRWPFGVDHLVVSGRSLADGRALEERINP